MAQTPEARQRRARRLVVMKLAGIMRIEIDLARTRTGPPNWSCREQHEAVIHRIRADLAKPNDRYFWWSATPTFADVLEEATPSRSRRSVRGPATPPRR